MIWRYLRTIYNRFRGSKTPSEGPSKIQKKDGFTRKKDRRIVESKSSESQGSGGGLMAKGERRLLESEAAEPIKHPLEMPTAPRIEIKSPELSRPSPATTETAWGMPSGKFLEMAVGKLRAYKKEKQPKIRIILQQRRTIRRCQRGVREARKRLQAVEASKGTSESFKNVVVMKKSSNF